MRRLLPEFSDLDGGANRFPSNYHSLQTKLVKRFSRGVQFNFNYTWGKVLDYQSSLAEWKTQDPFNIKNDYGPASIDIRHAVNLSYVVDLPFGRGRAIGSGWNRVTDIVLGGWTLDGFVRAQTGRPYNVVSGRDVANVGRTYQRPDVSGDPNNGPKTPDQWFATGVFTFPQPFTYGNAGSFIVRGDGRHSWDISMGKQVRFKEQHRIEFRSEFFNAFNTTKFDGPNSNLSSSAFGQVTSTAPNRQIQFALRYAF